VDDPAETPIAAEPMPAPADESRPLARFRALQIISILLVLLGFAAIWVGLAVGAPIGEAGPDFEISEDVLVAFGGVAGGSILIVLGLAINAARALVVRERLPASRYRGPSIVVLLLLSTIVTVLLSAPYLTDIASFATGDEISVLSALVILSGTQAGLVAVAVVFVAMPDALAGLRLLPPANAVRSVLIGLAAAVPAWIGASLIAYILTRLLELLGVSPEAGVVDQAVATLDPTVLILAVVLIAPVAEELFFRGVVFNAWLREYGARRAILGSAALFAVIHANPATWDALIGSVVSVVPIFGLGLALALLYHRTRNLVAAMALHAGFNAISITLALLARLYGWELPT
jgi:membrane protease YdiL (CAAX protease family)